MWNKSISLPLPVLPEQDADGFPVPAGDTLIQHIPARQRTTSRTDETLASQGGYTIDMAIDINKVAYSGQPYFIDEADGAIYDIRATRPRQRGVLIQLTGELREHGKI